MAMNSSWVYFIVGAIFIVIAILLFVGFNYIYDDPQSLKSEFNVFQIFVLLLAIISLAYGVYLLIYSFYL